MIYQTTNDAEEALNEEVLQGVSLKSGNYSLQCRFEQSYVAHENDLGSESINYSPRCINLVRPTKCRRCIKANVILILTGLFTT